MLPKPTPCEVENNRTATAYRYLLGGIMELRRWARREKLFDLCEKLERLEYTSERLARQPEVKSALRALGFNVVVPEVEE